MADRKASYAFAVSDGMNSRIEWYQDNGGVLEKTGEFKSSYPIDYFAHLTDREEELDVTPHMEFTHPDRVYLSNLVTNANQDSFRSQIVGLVRDGTDYATLQANSTPFGYGGDIQAYRGISLRFVRPNADHGPDGNYYGILKTVESAATNAGGLNKFNVTRINNILGYQPTPASYLPKAFIEDICIHPKALVAVRGSKTTEACGFYPYSTYDASYGQIFSQNYTELPLPTGFGISKMAFSLDGSWLYALDKWSKVCHIFRFNDSAVSFDYFGNTQINQAGQLRDIAVSPSMKTLAIASKSNDVFETKIYDIGAASITESMSISGSFGAMMRFSHDEKYLIDGRKRRALRKTSGGWVEDDTVVANLPEKIYAQAFSPDALEPRSTNRLYVAALDALLKNEVNLDDLKIALLSEAATYSEGETNASTVLANEVHGFNWPQGGVALTNRSEVNSGYRSGTDYDDPSGDVAGGELTFKNALVYEASTDLPIAFLSYDSPVLIEADTTITFKLSDFGLIVLIA